MFDFSISKLLLIGIVALVVIGPEKFPTVARNFGAWLGKMRRYMDTVRYELQQTIQTEDLHRLRGSLTQASNDLKSSVQAMTEDFRSALPTENSLLSDDGLEQISMVPTSMTTQPTFLIKKAHWISRKTAIPQWYKKQHRTRQKLLSAAARVQKYRPPTSSNG
ncbi:MAG: Sec-independent protein translocase protein TatB [Gammaproteobacteria bacterium]|nr:Sec-independent protein translocase protein TatB [Gammaproteobacteria bacterium]